MSVKKRLPIGIENFEEFRTDNFYYVDKSMFIADLIRNYGKVNLFTRPRRFGKSLNMSMLKCFFEIGKEKALFDGLQISKEKEILSSYQGKYPVISISLKNVDGLNFNMAQASLRTVIGNESGRFQFLKDSNALSDEEKKAYSQLISVGKERGGIYDMSDEAMVSSLKTLSSLLCKHYGKKAIVLIDEYDVPLDKAFKQGYYLEMVSLMRNLFSNALKTNDDLFFAVLSGCLRISKESIFTGLNNLKVHTISDVRYDEYFGFTKEEVDDLLSYYGLSDKKDDVKNWYDGYLFGKENIYCPWDVINYCDLLLSNKEAKAENYWANTSSNDIIIGLLSLADQTTKDEIEELMEGKSIFKSIKEELTYRDLDESKENIWSVLYATGYLTKVQSSSSKETELKIPNLEIKELFSDLTKEWFFKSARSEYSKIDQFSASFINSNVETIEKMLNSYLWMSISVRDSASKESFYHGLLINLLQSQENWLLKSNRETGKGYSDILISTPERIGIIIELKYAYDGNLEETAKRAITQIDDKNYASELKDNGMKKILKYGIAFYKKECKVVLA